MNVLVTGASRGIGFELALKYASRGYTVFALSRNSAQLDVLASESAAKGNIIPVCCDLEDQSAVIAAVDALKKSVKSLEIVVCNAGAFVNKPFSTLSREDIQHVYAVNVYGVIHLLQEILPLLGTKDGSHVVTISSMGGFQGSVKFPGMSAYSSSKAALACLTECLAAEYADRPIKWNCLALGAVQTEMLESAFPGYKAPVSASEMADYIVDFSLTAGKVLNGKTLPVSLSTP